MTADRARQKLLLWAAEQIGYCEGGDNFNQYAAMPEISRLLGWDAQNQPWCNIFVLAAFVCCFGLETGAAMLYQRVGHGSALCRASAQFFKDAGAWHTRPEPGNVVFFYVGGEINHMGIVSRVYTGSVVTIEGNSSDMVTERVYAAGDARIAGYGRPKWELAVDDPVEDINSPGKEPPQEREIETCDVTIPTIRNGDTGAAVAALQAALKHIGFDPVWIDGEAGERTEAALRAFQEASGIEAHGICGAETWEKIMQN